MTGTSLASSKIASFDSHVLLSGAGRVVWDRGRNFEIVCFDTVEYLTKANIWTSEDEVQVAIHVVVSLNVDNRVTWRLLNIHVAPETLVRPGSEHIGTVKVGAVGDHHAFSPQRIMGRRLGSVRNTVRLPSW